MRTKLFIILLLIVSLTFSQKRSIDKGGGDWKQLNLAVSTLDWIEQNQPEKILNFLSSKTNIEGKLLKKNCKYVSQNFGYHEGKPPSYVNSKDTTLWYERTYLEKLKDGPKYLFQICIYLVIENNVTKIDKIEFRRNENIIPRNEEWSKVVNWDNNTPPPPPPPPGLPKK